jgi:hypothetical protein
MRHAPSQGELEANHSILIVKTIEHPEQAFSSLRQNGAYDISFRLRGARPNVDQTTNERNVRPGNNDPSVQPGNNNPNVQPGTYDPTGQKPSPVIYRSRRNLIPHDFGGRSAIVQVPKYLMV